MKSGSADPATPAAPRHTPFRVCLHSLPGKSAAADAAAAAMSSTSALTGAAILAADRSIVAEASIDASLSGPGAFVRRSVTPAYIAMPGFHSRQAERLGLRRLSSLTVHVLVRDGCAFACVATPSFPDAVARRFCTAAADAWKAAVEERATATFAAVTLRALLERYADADHSSRAESVQSLSSAVDDVKDLMRSNVSALLQNRDDLEALEDRSTRLLSEAATFERSGRDVRRRQCCRDMKARAVFACLLVLLAAGAAVVITGPVLKLWT